MLPKLFPQHYFQVHGSWFGWFCAVCYNRITIKLILQFFLLLASHFFFCRI